ncbi:MFS transporter [bacterium]|nr:MFS transporter [bacterium]
MIERTDRWRILFALLLGVIMGPIDISIVNINLPLIAETFSVPAYRIAWVSISYLLMLSTLLLPFGRLGDMFGFKKLYLSGLLIFTLISLICALSPSFLFLVISRGLQAVGAGITMSLAPAIITAIFPPNERGRALGLYALSVALGLAIGPSLGGFLGSLFGWRSIFLANIPFGILAFSLNLKLLPEEGKKEKAIFDYLGASLSFTFLLSLLLFITEAPKFGFNSPFLILLFLGFLLIYVLIKWEGIFPAPLIDLSLFRNRVFSLAISSAFLNYLTQYILILSLPFYLQRILNYSAKDAGALMTAFPLTTLFVAPLAGWLSDKIGHRVPALLGLSLCTLAAFLFSFLTPNDEKTSIIWRLSLYGLGTGLFQSPNNSAVMGAVGRKRLGIGGGILATVRNMGMVFGLGTASAVLSWRLKLYSSLNLQNPFFLSLRDAFLSAGLISGITVILAIANFLDIDKQGNLVKMINSKGR